MDINLTSITFGSLFALVGIILTALSFFRSNKKDTQEKAKSYAMLEQKVEHLEEVVAELKSELKEGRKEWKQEISKLDMQILKKVGIVESKIDDLKNLLLKKNEK